MAVEPLDRMERMPVPRVGRIRRCWVRHVSIVATRGKATAKVECGLGGKDHWLPLGSMDEARAICNACTATTIWRADED